VYIADTGDNAIKEWVRSSNTVATLVSSGLNSPYGIAIDANGNVYFADTFNNAIKEWVRSSNGVVTLVSSGVNSPYGVAVDANGNVYLADTGDNAIKEWLRASNTTTTLVSSGLNDPLGVAVDGGGDVFIADTFNNALKEGVSASSAVASLFSSGLALPSGVAVDQSGNVYIADPSHNAIQELVGGLAFTTEPENATATVGQSSSVSLVVAATGGTAPLSYRWQISNDNGLSFRDVSDGSGVAGATTSTLTLSDFTTAGSPEYRSVVTDANGVMNTSSPESLTVNAAPSITAPPQNATSTVGQSAFQSFTIAASGGTGPLTPQWLISTDNGLSFTVLSDDSGVAGATTTTLTVSGFTAPGSLEYKAIVTDANGVTAISSAATLTISPSPVPDMGVISGTVFHDYTTNGIQDSGEPGLAGQTVFIDLNGSGVWQPGDPTALTDANGNYQFQGPSAGSYIVRQLLLGGVLLSTPASGSSRVTLTSGASVTGVNFADVLTSIAIPLTLPPRTAFPAQGSANADYVEAVYRAVLNREADLAGLANWTNLLNSGAMSRFQVVQGIRNSPEHFTQEVTAFYETLLGRAPDSAGLQNWVQLLQGGMREEQIAFYFLNSPEYLSQGDKHFVDAMYNSLLGRSFDAAGEATWLDALGDDASGNPTHAPSLAHPQVITDFLYSQESLTRLTEGYYEVFLQRQADPGGLSSWVGNLQQGLSFLTIGQQFLSSDEFYNGAASEA
jgi:hypothetical protein